MSIVVLTGVQPAGGGVALKNALTVTIPPIVVVPGPTVTTGADLESTVVLAQTIAGGVPMHASTT
jgi:hypothetical protein